MDAFNIYLGDSGLGMTYQDDFPQTTPCCRCGGESRIAFVAIEGNSAPESEHVCDVHPNDPDGEGFWLHDACAVAIYFCKKCLEPTALYNQA
jgi:hypothetical protein